VVTEKDLSSVRFIFFAIKILPKQHKTGIFFTGSPDFSPEGELNANGRFHRLLLLLFGGFIPNMPS
jgi:hypothetical protein